MQSKKVCLVGRFGVGKTSLVDRYVKNHFSEKYLTTVGVSIATKVIDQHLKFIIWDIAGFEQKNHYQPYLRGTHGVIYVVDSTQAESVSAITKIIAENPTIKDLPSICFINKKDLLEQRVWSEQMDAEVTAIGCPSIWTSAKTGEDVEQGFQQLASLLV